MPYEVTLPITARTAAQIGDDIAGNYAGTLTTYALDLSIWPIPGRWKATSVRKDSDGHWVTIQRLEVL